jgi:Flp pilus assembly protein TadG
MSPTLPARGAMRRRGVATVELAVLLPLLMFLLLITIDFGRVFYYSQTIESCAHIGALNAVNGGSFGASPEETARNAALADGAHLNPPLASDQVTVSVSGDEITVTVTYPFQTITDYPMIPQTTHLTRTVTVRGSPITP